MLEPSSFIKPQRILMTADTVGGVWTYAVELARALAPHGVEVALATMGGPLTRSHREQVRPLTNVGIFESAYRLEWMEDPWRDVEEAGDWLLEIERRTHPDLIHLNGYAHGALPWLAPMMMVGHSCVLSWWRAVRGSDAPSSWARYRDELRRGLAAARIVIAPTQAMLDELRRYYGPFAEGRVIANSVDPLLFTRATKQPFILSAGRLWDEAKNIAALAEAAPRLDWPVCVAGDHRHPDGGEATHAKIRFLGQLPHQELASWFAHASIFALPARYEPFGLAALEAAHAECALVLGDIASLRELWDGAALFVSPDDADALADALRMLIADTTQRKALAARARFRARDFTIERTAAGYLAAYADLLGSAARAKEEAACA
ncbi:MAG: glycosyltransferase family 4 protein [Blastocatellia bacterium]